MTFLKNLGKIEIIPVQLGVAPLWKLRRGNFYNFTKRLKLILVIRPVLRFLTSAFNCKNNHGPYIRRCHWARTYSTVHHIFWRRPLRRWLRHPMTVAPLLTPPKTDSRDEPWQALLDLPDEQFSAPASGPSGPSMHYTDGLVTIPDLNLILETHYGQLALTPSFYAHWHELKFLIYSPPDGAVEMSDGTVLQPAEQRVGSSVQDRLKFLITTELLTSLRHTATTNHLAVCFSE